MAKAAKVVAGWETWRDMEICFFLWKNVWVFNTWSPCQLNCPVCIASPWPNLWRSCCSPHLPSVDMTVEYCEVVQGSPGSPWTWCASLRATRALQLWPWNKCLCTGSLPPLFVRIWYTGGFSFWDGIKHTDAALPSENDCSLLQLKYQLFYCPAAGSRKKRKNILHRNPTNRFPGPEKNILYWWVNQR